MGNRTEPQKAVKLDGRKGEGGGQLVRVAITLAAITGTPIVIQNVRANRERGGRGGGKLSALTLSSSYKNIKMQKQCKNTGRGNQMRFD